MRPAVLALALAALEFGVAGPALAAGADLTAAPPGASSCSGCHAARTGVGAGVPAIHGRPADEIMAALAAFRGGKRPATVMNRILPAFSDTELRAIALWLSHQPAP